MTPARLFVAACLVASPVVWAQASAPDAAQTTVANPAQAAPPSPTQAAAPDAAEAKRERDFKMPEIIRALDLKQGSKVADIGAGGGNYETAMARVIGADGRVYAEDINPGAIKRLKERVNDTHLANVEVVEGVADDPKLPESSLDAALMVIMYHEIADHEKMLEHVKAALKPGGRLVIVDMSPQKTQTRPRADQVKNHVIAPDLVEAEVRQAGFEVLSRDDHFIDHPDEESTRFMIVFQKAGARQ